MNVISNHYTDRGTWCRWSHVQVSDKFVAGQPQGQERCPSECRNSRISKTEEV